MLKTPALILKKQNLGETDPPSPTATEGRAEC